MPAGGSNADGRPSPEALLAVAGKADRGRLKIFLGAAPGVGKTYEMLLAARRRRAEGIDLLVGVVETHGRAETQALLEGLTIQPRRTVEYKGRTLGEMDLDAILARRPALVLVDELAHTNAPGSRHAKRYLDVLELLGAGIDVFTTLNVQHVESLNDVVARITRIRVRETVPDSIIDAADEVEVVDTTPGELIERLREGKVYVREQAQRALGHYFSLGNLTALRELVLRRTAQRVDDEMLRYMRAHAISGPWGAGDRILVCVDAGPEAATLVRYARRLSDRLRAPWTALHVELPRHHGRGGDAVHATLRLAEQLGGTAVTLPGRTVVAEILEYARSHNVTHIVAGKATRPRWLERLFGSVVHDLLHGAGPIVTHVIAGERAAPAGKATREPIALLPYLASGLFVAAATAIGLAIDASIELENISLVFVAAVLASAIRYGRWPSVFASLCAVTAYNFFFLSPRWSLTIADPANVMALVFFTITALLTSGVAAGMRGQTLLARRQARTTADLYGFARKLAGIADLDDLLWATAWQISSMLKVEVVILLPEAGTLAVRAAYPPEDRIDAADLAAASWAWSRNEPTGRGADTLPGAPRLFVPLATAEGTLGVVGIVVPRDDGLMSPDERRLLSALADQAAVAIERTRLVDSMAEARRTAETERLRAALLTSVSHDLKTPLATIIGAVTSLRRYADRYDGATRDELLLSAQEEAERLERFVANLLDMTRLDSGALQLELTPVDPADLVGAALQRAARMVEHHAVTTDMPADLPMPRLDFVLAVQILVNLLDNAAKYAPPGSRIDITGRRDQDALVISVSDEGAGLPEADLERVFDKFYRVQQADRQRAGTGLGLAICRGFATAMGGTVHAENRTDRPGARFVLRFPVPPE